ncbi:hypothetical protein [Rhizobium leucaenae]|jgi:hypothetical protein|uniref:Uncharacterized protein n=1 Tax=Rhizobium leucaenae TaxID=29450 RepID=A0A7W7EMA4_9HYPH|nr:hypothetical protein [Rhizobium leucaenae]MBB4570750.1 hypothetical protein [Rhizobium leucaenae]MBB6303709.1 hypothetical protein [Rhizobium leucaenae]
MTDCLADAENEYNPHFEYSPLSRPFIADGISVIVEIFRPFGEDCGWNLQVVDEGLDITVWMDVFDTDVEAFEQFLQTVELEGIDSFAATPIKPLH